MTAIGPCLYLLGMMTTAFAVRVCVCEIRQMVTETANHSLMHEICIRESDCVSVNVS